MRKVCIDALRRWRRAVGLAEEGAVVGVDGMEPALEPEAVRALRGEVCGMEALLPGPVGW